MKSLRLASFGIRGFVGTSFDPRDAIHYAAAFGTFVDGGRVMLGRDTRSSSEMLHAAAMSGLMACGCEVVDCGVCPTPILQWAVPQRGAAGALSITGGHHDRGWNAIHLVGPDGAFLNHQGGGSVLDFFHSGDFLRQPWDHIGLAHDDSPATGYFDALEAFVDAPAIRAAAFRVVIDPVGGGGCAYLPEFARRLGLDLVAVNGDPSGYLARDPEPRPRTAKPLASIIPHLRAGAGFVLSSDMSRLSLVTESGEPVSEELTFPLIARHVLSRTPGPVVANECSSRTLDRVAADAGCPLVKSAVGQSNVVAAMIDERAVLAGEGSGGVAVAGFGRGFDGFLMMALVLEAMAKSGRPLSSLVGGLPRYFMLKRQVDLSPREAHAAITRAERHLRMTAGAVTEGDGVRCDWPDGWVHVRVSRTEQVVRVISESETRELAESRSEDCLRVLGSAEGIA